MHGWGGSANSLSKLQDDLVEKGFLVYDLDLPGFGKSPLTKEVMDMDDYANEVKKMIKDRKIENPILIGHSFGGKIATKIAIEDPSLISGIVLIAASGIKPDNENKKNIFKNISRFGKKIFSLPVLKSIYKPVRKFYYYYIVRERDYFNAGEKLAKTFEKVNSEFYGDLLGLIDIPTLIIWGELDSITPLWMGKEYSEKIKRAKLEVVEGVGHNLPLIKPEIVSEIIYNYLTNFN